MQDQQIIQIIENLKGRRNYEEKKATKLGFKSLYAYFENKILKEKKAAEEKKKELEAIKSSKEKKKELEAIKSSKEIIKTKKKSCSCC